MPINLLKMTGIAVNREVDVVKASSEIRSFPGGNPKRGGNQED